MESFNSGSILVFIKQCKPSGMCCRYDWTKAPVPNSKLLHSLCIFFTRIKENILIVTDIIFSSRCNTKFPYYLWKHRKRMKNYFKVKFAPHIRACRNHNKSFFPLSSRQYKRRLECRLRPQPMAPQITEICWCALSCLFIPYQHCCMLCSWNN